MFTFLKNGNVAFFRSDAEQAEWTQEEMNLLCTFPYDEKKVIERGMTVLFQDPATGAYQAYEIRNISSFVAEGYQQFTAEDLAIAELTDCHIADEIELTDISAKEALKKVLKNTGWSVGTDESGSAVSSGDLYRGSVWQAVCDIRNNWNVYIHTRVSVDASGISGRHLDIISSEGTWRGLRLAVNKNTDDPCVTYDDSELYTALYAYGASYSEGTGEDRKTLEKNITDVTWSKTSKHPAKPKGQNYLEWPEKTALYGRNGKPRFGYYQNGDIEDPNILIQKTWESLQQCADPKISITGTVTDLKRLGYADQPLRLHDMVIVDLEPLGVQFYKQIIQLTVDLLNPDKNTPNIGDYIPNIIYINRRTDNDATGGGRGRGGGTRSKKKQGEFETDIFQNERNIYLNARQIGEQGKILRQAGMSIDPETGVIIYAEDNVNNIGSKFHVMSDAIYSEVEARKEGENSLKSTIEQTAESITLSVSNTIKNVRSEIKQEADRISLVVEGTGDNAKIKSAQIVAAINGSQSEVKISADHIVLDGEAVATSLGGQDISCGTLTVEGRSEFYQTVEIGQGISFDSGAGINIDDGKIKMGSYNASWKEKTIEQYTLSDTARYYGYFNTLTHEYMGATLGKVVTGTSTVTLHYLGRS